MIPLMFYLYVVMDLSISEENEGDFHQFCCLDP